MVDVPKTVVSGPCGSFGWPQRVYIGTMVGGRSSQECVHIVQSFRFFGLEGVEIFSYLLFGHSGLVVEKYGCRHVVQRVEE